MRRYKLVDYWIQVILITSSLFYCVFIDSSFIFFAYLIVGGWQLFSCLLHAIWKEDFYAARDRKIYLKTLLWVLVLAVLTIPLWICFWFGMLFLSPILAVWYTMICYTENSLLARKNLVHLK